jgi:hypothetical protein
VSLFGARAPTAKKASLRVLPQVEAPQLVGGEERPHEPDGEGRHGDERHRLHQVAAANWTDVLATSRASRAPAGVDERERVSSMMALTAFPAIHPLLWSTDRSLMPTAMSNVQTIFRNR